MGGNLKGKRGKVARGTLAVTGGTISQTISGLGFQPDVVSITAQYANGSLTFCGYNDFVVPWNAGASHNQFGSGSASHGQSATPNADGFVIGIIGLPVNAGDNGTLHWVATKL